VPSPFVLEPGGVGVTVDHATQDADNPDAEHEHRDAQVEENHHRDGQENALDHSHGGEVTPGPGMRGEC